MAGLTNFFSDSQQTQTTLPTWYDQAQQNIVTQGQQAYTGAPQLGQTVAQGAINQLSGSANPFTQAESTLGQISSGAANPWIVGPNNTVTPNVNTALGGLFQAQNQQLQQLMPNITAAPTAAGTASGQFGSLRQQTATDKAAADAQSQLLAQQMQAALQNQQIGTSAATGLGTVGQQGVNAAMNVGIEQQNAPFRNIGNLASLVGTVQAPSTVTSQRQLSPWSQATTIANALSGGAGSGLLQALVGKGGLSALTGSGGILGGLAGLMGASGLAKLLGGIGGSSGSNGSAAGSYATYDESGNQNGYLQINSDGTQTQYNNDGSITNWDASGNVINELPAGSTTDIQNQQEQTNNQDNNSSSDTPAYDALVNSGQTNDAGQYTGSDSYYTTE